MKIFLTGAKQIGKTTCVRHWIEKSKMPVWGFFSLPYFQNGKRAGFVLHSILEREENDVPFSKGKKVIKGVFDNFGTDILSHPGPGVLILDEIGFLEKEEKIYLETLMHSIDQTEAILGVLRKQDLPYIQAIKDREDTLILDLDVLDHQQVLKTLFNSFGSL